MVSNEQSTGPIENRAASGLDFAAERIVPGKSRDGRWRSLTSLGLALVVHAGFAALAVVLLQWRDLATAPEEAITVEVVAHLPSTPAPDHPDRDRARPSGPDAPASPGSATASEPQPASEPAARAADQNPDPASASPRPDLKDRDQHGTPPPALVEPPPEPKAAATTKELPRQPANTEPERPNTPPAKSPPPAAPAPQVLSAAAGSFAVAPTAPPSSDPAKSGHPAPAAPERDPAAELAAALPMDLSGLPSSFRAVLSGGGQMPNDDDYRGLVFGQLGRSQGAIAEAQSHHLRGTVMVSFSIADDGQLANLKVGHSSGSAAVDALALRMVREAAPFPPPPPNSQRSFTPVLTFGEH